MSEDIRASTQASWQRGLAARSASLGSVLHERSHLGRRANATKLEGRNLQDLDRTEVLAAHVARQQARLRRNIHTIESDADWKVCYKKLVSTHCGAVAFFRRHGCPSCNCIAPKLSETSNDFEVHHHKDVLFVEVDVEKCPRTAVSFQADTLAPSFCVFSHGEKRATFNGVSTQVFENHIEQLRTSIVTCPRCTSDMRAHFDSLEQELIEAVRTGLMHVGRPLQILQCDGRAGRPRFEGHVPSGEKIVPFDINALNEPLKTRIEILEERLYGPPSLFHVCRRGRHNMLALEFLSSTKDEGLKADEARGIALNWLTERLGHPSLWDGEERPTVSTIADAIVARRAARVEYWLLRSLNGIHGRSASRRQWSDELRRSLYSKMCELWMSIRPCAAKCAKCDLPCVLHRNHADEHCCGSDDHRCHRLTTDGDDGVPSSSPRAQSQSKCQMHAGHAGPCRTQPPAFDPGEDCVCAICLESLPRPNVPDEQSGSATTDTPALVLPCMHAFHVRCAQPWLQRSSLCPLCRSPTHQSMLRGSFGADADSMHDLSSSRRRHGTASHLRQLRRMANAPMSASQILEDQVVGSSLGAPSWSDSSGNRTIRVGGSRGLPALPSIEQIAASMADQAAQALDRAGPLSTGAPSLPESLSHRSVGNGAGRGHPALPAMEHIAAVVAEQAAHVSDQAVPSSLGAPSVAESLSHRSARAGASRQALPAMEHIAVPTADQAPQALSSRSTGVPLRPSLPPLSGRDQEVAPPSGSETATDL